MRAVQLALFTGIVAPVDVSNAIGLVETTTKDRIDSDTSSSSADVVTSSHKATTTPLERHPFGRILLALDTAPILEIIRDAVTDLQALLLDDGRPFLSLLLLAAADDGAPQASTHATTTATEAAVTAEAGAATTPTTNIESGVPQMQKTAGGVNHSSAEEEDERQRVRQRKQKMTLIEQELHFALLRMVAAPVITRLVSAVRLEYGVVDCASWNTVVRLQVTGTTTTPTVTSLDTPLSRARFRLLRRASRLPALVPKHVRRKRAKRELKRRHAELIALRHQLGGEPISTDLDLVEKESMTAVGSATSGGDDDDDDDNDEEDDGDDDAIYLAVLRISMLMRQACDASSGAVVVSLNFVSRTCIRFI